MKRFSRKALSFASAAVLALSMANLLPVSAYDDSPAQEIVVVSENFDSGSIQIKPDYKLVNPDGYEFKDKYYNQLDEASKGIYDTIYDAFKDGAKYDVKIDGGMATDSITVCESEVEGKCRKVGGSVTLTDATNAAVSAVIADYDQDIQDALAAIIIDHPEMYWINLGSSWGSSKSFSYSSSGASEMPCTVKVKMSVRLILNTADNASMKGTAKADIDKAVVAAHEYIGDSDSPYEIVKAIHDYLLNALRYNHEAASYPNKYTPDENDMYQTVYSAFYKCNGDTERQTVCAGYATGFKVLCDSYGIPCVYISGLGGMPDSQGGHAWNLVQIGQDWYAVDSTWDDMDDGDIHEIYYGNFLVGSETLNVYYDSSKGKNVEHTFSETHTPVNMILSEDKQSYPLVAPPLSAQKYDETLKAILLSSTTVDMKNKSIAKLSASKSTFHEGDSATVTAAEVEGYKFMGWYQADSADSSKYTGEAVCTDLSYSFVVGKAEPKLVAVYSPVSELKLTVSGESGYSISVDDGEAVDCTDEQVKYLKVGTKITVTAESDGFAYWANEKGGIVSKSPTYTFKLTNNYEIKAVYDKCDENQAVVSFVSAYNQVLDRKVCVKSDDFTVPKVPTKINSVFKGWSVNGGEAVANDKVAATVSEALVNAFATADSDDNFITVKAVYESIKQEIGITVTNGTGGGSFNIGGIVTVKADEAAEGKKFSHWTDDKGNILSYNAEYTFFALKNMAVKAVYVETSADVSAVGSARVDSVTVDKESSKIAVVGVFDVPDGCTIETAGIIATAKSEISDSFDETNANLASKSVGDVKNYRFDRILNVSEVNADRVFYFRAYMVYSDSEGNICKVYSDIVSASINGGVI